MVLALVAHTLLVQNTLPAFATKLASVESREEYLKEKKYVLFFTQKYSLSSTVCTKKDSEWHLPAIPKTKILTPRYAAYRAVSSILPDLPATLDLPAFLAKIPL
jgi:hypothetical protein